MKPSTPNEPDARGCVNISEEKKRELVANYARGNVNLQLGRFSSYEDIEERKRKIFEHNFTSPF
tara:strand:- start:519 stop:710 length:192 start_codon:yes stop_codon:yes gene_type:complete